jgi:hypothetical protein
MSNSSGTNGKPMISAKQINAANIRRIPKTNFFMFHLSINNGIVQKKF